MSGLVARLARFGLVGLLLFLFSEGLYAEGGALSAAVALAAVASGLVTCAVIAARCVPAVPPTRVRTAIRDREQRTAFLPQRDPDASGRRRPRAPGRLVATAA
ncbi:hypothetical protein AMK26_00810 [Streptomyces sp. CB03234]|uniref:DUF6412 domain-containing protein n=1 Tax=Streptomyces sp. (strain CB03234) TaxID=1703937 RepID=UPI00093AF536|nr:DUF6412 domain-containing protein [Streptomyces sp. CB03234]OKK07668.1 hypothetical protein AMK26_00810 [Streptomyces sp. CB03234]